MYHAISHVWFYFIKKNASMSITTVNTCNTTITTDLSAIERLMDHGKWEVLWVGREWEGGEREVVRERIKRVGRK